MRRCARRTKPAMSQRNRTAGSCTPQSRKRWTSASSSSGRFETTWSRPARPSWRRPTSFTSPSRTSTGEPIRTASTGSTRSWRHTPTWSRIGSAASSSSRHEMTEEHMKIAVLGAGRVGSTLGGLWHAAGHDVTFAARHATRPRALAAELGERAHAASVADAVAGAEVVLVAVPGPAVTGALQAAGPLDGRIVIDAANSLERGVFGQQQQLSLRSLADTFPRARWVRAFNSLSVSVMADDNHREPPWVLFLSGDKEAKPVVAQLIRDAGFDPVDLGGIDDSQLQDPGSAL